MEVNGDEVALQEMSFGWLEYGWSRLGRLIKMGHTKNGYLVFQCDEFEFYHYYYYYYLLHDFVNVILLFVG